MKLIVSLTEICEKIKAQSEKSHMLQFHFKIYKTQKLSPGYIQNMLLLLERGQLLGLSCAPALKSQSPEMHEGGI